ncbi:MAG: hypothetical protein HY360_19345 [Verrucomicrobia bacterium]|nr:hypothetical protein [Verrucomicrobiota bacterium]
MKIWLTHNFKLKVLSVVLATVIWWLINSKIGPEPDAPDSSGAVRHGYSAP